MGIIPKALKALTLDLQRLPGIGPKSARRIAYYMFTLPQSRLEFLSQTIKDLQQSVTVCQFCRLLSDTNPCEICGDSARNPLQICVVEDNMDVFAIEKSGTYKGVYFVLGGILSPAKGIGVDDIAIASLQKRVSDVLKLHNNGSVEIILALSPSTEGQTTSLYIKELFTENHKVSVTRFAIGISVGSDLDYVDSYTLQEAMRGRIKVE
jgi:recombination protein RecR